MEHTNSRAKSPPTDESTDDRPALTGATVRDEGTEFLVVYEDDEQARDGEVTVADTAVVVEVPGR